MDAGIPGTGPGQASGEGVMSLKSDGKAAFLNQMTQRLSNICKG
jgi:hypothetical protein